ncbi:hypothetical protein DFH05DRAFT_1480693 [Lentinula detonsa]|uniref:Uncharacterized protein n=1 Tax=Lentinula detonsa TaxID=2804962 RepID=A0A9W8P5W0_9AGAR|nr:hypothetical protein DFH05DRAFT_1480693 [Lentinula detonsa]
MSPQTLNWQNAVLQLSIIGIIWLFSSLPGIVHFVYELLSVSSDRPWSVTQSCLKLHPYTTICCSSVIFLGPISFVLPLLILQDTCMHVWFIMIHLFHGYISVWNCARYYHSSNSLDFVPGLGGAFAWLERIATVYNTWTMEHKSLLVIRVFAAVIGLYVATIQFYFGW